MGITAEQARAELARRRQAAQPSAPSSMPSLARGLAQQAGQGVSFSFSDELSGLMNSLMAEMRGEDPIEGYRGTVLSERDMMDAFRAENPGLSLGANILGGLLTGGVGVTAMKAAGQVGARALLGAGAVEGALGGAGAAEGGLMERAKGAAIGGALGAGASAVTGTLGRFFGGRTGFEQGAIQADDFGRTAADRAQSLGIVLSAGEEAADASMKNTESLLNRLAATGWATRGRDQANQKAINKAVLDRFGFTGDRITGRVLGQIKDKANALYDDFANIVGRGTFSVTPGYRQAMGEAVQAWRLIDDNPTLADNVQKRMQSIAKRVAGGRANGKTIKYALNELRNLAAEARKNPAKAAAADAYDAMQTALFEALDPGSNAQARAALDTARRYWRDMKLIDNASVLEAIKGDIKPSGLSSALDRSKFTREAFTRGVEPDNPIFEVGRLVRQIGDDANSIVGKFRSSKTSEANLMNQILGIGLAPALIPAALGQTTRTGQAIATEATQRLLPAVSREAGAQPNR